MDKKNLIIKLFKSLRGEKQEMLHHNFKFNYFFLIIGDHPTDPILSFLIIFCFGTIFNYNSFNFFKAGVLFILFIFSLSF